MHALSTMQVSSTSIDSPGLRSQQAATKDDFKLGEYQRAGAILHRTSQVSQVLRSLLSIQCLAMIAIWYSF